jgi:hypothetical protein
VLQPLLSLLTALIVTVRLVLALYTYRGQSHTQCLRNPQCTYVLRERRRSYSAGEVERTRNKDGGVYYRVIALIVLITPMSIESPEGR